jgi:predicted nucleotidyltransferase
MNIQETIPIKKRRNSVTQLCYNQVNHDRTNHREGAKPLSLEILLKEKREDILRIASMRGASNVRVFGSVARGEADSKSDIDLLVDMEPGRSIFDLGGLLMDLQDLLDHKVDVVTERGLRDRIRDRVLNEAIPL